MVKVSELPINMNIKISSLIGEQTLLVKGSESFLFKSNFLGLNIVIKERKTKKYRNLIIDNEIRLSRMRLEARIIKILLQNQINVPPIYAIDLRGNKLFLEYINGFSLSKKIQNNYFYELGKIVYKLHDIDIIHGDLTPLNVIITNKNKMYLIDFGLAYFSDENKDKIMDLFILKGSLKLFFAEEMFESFMIGYSELLEDKEFLKIQNQLDSLSMKGRYRKT